MLHDLRIHLQQAVTFERSFHVWSVQIISKATESPLALNMDAEVFPASIFLCSHRSQLLWHLGKSLKTVSDPICLLPKSLPGLTTHMPSSLGATGKFHVASVSFHVLCNLWQVTYKTSHFPSTVVFMVRNSCMFTSSPRI